VSSSEVKPSDLIRTKHYAPFYSTIQYSGLRTHRKYLDCKYPTCTRRINFFLLVTMPMVNPLYTVENGRENMNVVVKRKIPNTRSEIQPRLNDQTTGKNYGNSYSYAQLHTLNRNS
jgi:hypothetical protein